MGDRNDAEYVASKMVARHSYEGINSDLDEPNTGQSSELNRDWISFIKNFLIMPDYVINSATG